MDKEAPCITICSRSLRPAGERRRTSSRQGRFYPHHHCFYWLTWVAGELWCFRASFTADRLSSGRFGISPWPEFCSEGLPSSGSSHRPGRVSYRRPFPQFAHPVRQAAVGRVLMVFKLLPCQTDGGLCLTGDIQFRGILLSRSHTTPPLECAGSSYRLIFWSILNIWEEKFQQWSD